VIPTLPPVLDARCRMQPAQTQLKESSGEMCQVQSPLDMHVQHERQMVPLLRCQHAVQHMLIEQCVALAL